MYYFVVHVLYSQHYTCTLHHCQTEFNEPTPGWRYLALFPSLPLACVYIIFTLGQLNVSRVETWQRWYLVAKGVALIMYTPSHSCFNLWPALKKLPSLLKSLVSIIKNRAYTYFWRLNLHMQIIVSTYLLIMWNKLKMEQPIWRHVLDVHYTAHCMLTVPLVLCFLHSLFCSLSPPQVSSLSWVRPWVMTVCSQCSWLPRCGRWTSSTPSTVVRTPPRCTFPGEWAVGGFPCGDGIFPFVGLCHIQHHAQGIKYNCVFYTPCV